MGALGTVGTVVAIVVAVVVVVLVVGRIVVARIRRSSETAVAAAFAPGEVLRSDPMANYFGLESKGGKQIRGNGALVLTATRVWFTRAGSDAPLDIPLSTVTAVDIVRAHAGKRAGRDLLRVSFGDDSAAWYVRDPKVWAERILAARPAAR